MSQEPATSPIRGDGDRSGRRRPRVAVVFGGRSSEHAISCVTAGSVLAALDPERYDVVPIGIAPDGRWVLESADTDRLRISGTGRLPAVDPTGAALVLAAAATATELVVTAPGEPPRSLGDVDVVFPLLHGPWGEDGTLQGMLEMAGVRYVGAGVLASAVSMDKAYMKVVLAQAGLPVMPGVTVTATQWARDPAGVTRRCDELSGAGPAPRATLFVKPARGGSSIGISRVQHPEELGAALATAFAHDPKVIVELAATEAREVECGVLERLPDDPGSGPETSVPAEIRVGGDHAFYDFDAKYLPEESTELDVPADLTPATEARLRELAVRAFEAVGCEGLARVDFFVMPADGSDSGGERLVVNELNTMPGFTPTSMFPRMWAASGVDYPALVDRLVRLALARGTGLR